MLDRLIRLRDDLFKDPSAKEVDEKIKKRSAYNFIYGVSLFCFFRSKQIIVFDDEYNKRLADLPKIKRVKFIVRYMQNHYTNLFRIDIPEYNLDDYTVRFNEELLIDTVREVNKLDYNMSSDTFWQVQENFFIDSF